MLFKPYKFRLALWYAFLLWIIGFIWGMIVFMVPSQKAVQPIPYVSKYPAISFVLLPVYLVLVWFLARRYLRSTTEKAAEGLKLGIVILLVTVVLDTLTYFALFGGGDYFSFLSIWVSYAIFLLAPWLVGRRLQTSMPTRDGQKRFT